MPTPYNARHLRKKILRFKGAVPARQRSSSSSFQFMLTLKRMFPPSHINTDDQKALAKPLLAHQIAWTEESMQFPKGGTHWFHCVIIKGNMFYTTPWLLLFSFIPVDDKQKHQTASKHERTYKQMIKSNRSLCSFLCFVFCRQSYTSNSTQLIKVCMHGVSDGKIWGRCFGIFFQPPVIRRSL